eukprot:scaffold2735_cov58-Phaeocystis_antarctica.AAC.4
MSTEAPCPQLLRAAGGEQHVEAARGGLARSGGADARGRTGDHGPRRAVVGRGGGEHGREQWHKQRKHRQHDAQTNRQTNRETQLVVNCNYLSRATDTVKATPGQKAHATLLERSLGRSEGPGPRSNDLGAWMEGRRHARRAGVDGVGVPGLNQDPICTDEKHPPLSATTSQRILNGFLVLRASS